VPVWDPTSALSRLRSALADNTNDKFVYKIDVVPAPDGLNQTFFVGDYALVAGSVQAFVDGELLASTDIASIDLDKGQFTLVTPPVENSGVQASYQFQWFSDAELQSFLLDAANHLALTDVEDTNLPIAARPILLEFAKYHAYMFKAAETADTIKSTEDGFEVDKTKSSENWRAMADRAFETAIKMLETFKSDPLGIGPNPVAMKIVTFALESYVPRS